MHSERLLEAILELSPHIRYAALHLGGGEPLLRERSGADAVAADDERWDELVVNPTLVELACRRGDVDCGGAEYLLIRYGRHYNLVLPLDGGHLSIVIDPDGDPIGVAKLARDSAGRHGAAPRRSAGRA